jgi:hypothetical protein
LPPSTYCDELEAEFQPVSDPDDKYAFRIEGAVREIAENTIRCTRKRPKDEWFNEECEVVKEKNERAKHESHLEAYKNNRNSHKRGAFV